MLTLSEELFLLSLQEKKDSLGFSNSEALPYAMAGALLLELCLLDKIRLEGKKVALLESTPTGSELLNDLLANITAHPSKKAAYWIESYGSHAKRIRSAALASLVGQGILHEQEKSFLWVIPYTGYSEQDVWAKFGIKSRLRAVTLGSENPDRHTLALLSLVRAAGLLDHVFTRDEMRRAKRQVDVLVKDETIGQAVIETVEAIDAAVMVAVMASTGI